LAREEDNDKSLMQKFQWDARITTSQTAARKLNLALVQFLPEYLQARELHHQIVKLEDDYEPVTEWRQQTQVSREYSINCHDGRIRGTHRVEQDAHQRLKLEGRAALAHRRCAVRGLTKHVDALGRHQVPTRRQPTIPRP
jgi:hypothetical protein